MPRTKATRSEGVTWMLRFMAELGPGYKLVLEAKEQGSGYCLHAIPREVYDRIEREAVQEQSQCKGGVA